MATNKSNSQVDDIVEIAERHNVQSLRELSKVLSLQDIRLSKLSVAFIVYANKLENASVQIKSESQRLIALAKKYPTSVESHAY